MINKEFNTSIADALSDGMELLKKAGGSMIGYWFLLLPIFFASSFISDLIGQVPYIGSFIGQIGVNYVILSLLAGFTIFMNKAYHDSSNDFSNFFQGFPFGIKLLLNSLLKGVFAIPFLVIPIALFVSQLDFSNLPTDLNDPIKISAYIQSLMLNKTLVVPFIVLLVFMLIYQMLVQFSDALIIVKGTKVWDAFKASISGVWVNLVFFLSLFFVLLVMNLVGGMLFIVGLIFTVPYSMCILHVVFQKLFVSGQNKLFDEISNFGNSEEF